MEKHHRIKSMPSLRNYLIVAIVSIMGGHTTIAMSGSHAWVPHSFNLESGASLYYEVSDKCNPDASILLLHGIASSTKDWADVKDGIADHACVISLDLLGFGRSSRPGHADYSIDSQAERVLAFISTLCPSNTVLIAHSYGGAVALVALEKARQREMRLPISGLILVDVPAYPQKMPWFFRVLNMPIIDKIISLVPTRIAVILPLRTMFYDHDKLTPKIVDRYVSVLKQPGARRALAFSLKYIVPENLNIYLDSIHQISLPTLILSGDHDRLVRPQVARRLNRDIQHSSLKFIHKCGHVPQEEQPDEFQMAVNAYLTTWAGSRHDSP